MLCTLLTLASVTALAAPPQQPPNVVVIYLDDLGFGDVGAFGCKDIRTPGIDSLATAGVRLTNYYTVAPLCAPSRASLLTGRQPARIGMSTIKNVDSGLDVEGVPASEIMLPELFKKAGYATGAFGKWHLGSRPDTCPNGQGFDDFFGFLASCIDSFSHLYYASEPWYHDLFRNREMVYEDGIHMTDLITREATRFINERKDKPFFMYLAYNAPHYPIVFHRRHWEMFPDLPSPRREYAAMLAGADESIGIVLKKLKEVGAYENTIIFLGSDNGAAVKSKRGEGGGSNLPGREFKRSLYEGGIHMPGIISWPAGLKAGQTRSHLADNTDVYPTVAELAGLKLPEGVVYDGKSWAPWLRDANARGRDTIYFEWANQHAIRRGKWKLVENGLVDQANGRENRAKDADAAFLSDIEADPGEKHNLAAQHPEVVRELSAAHKAWLEEITHKP